MADAAEGREVIFPPLDRHHHAKVKATLGPLVAVANPLDYHTFIWNDLPAMTATFSAMVAGGFDLNMLVLDFPRSDRCFDIDWWPTVDAFEAALRAGSARGAIVSSMPENLPEEYCASLLDRGIVPLMGIAEALDAAEAAASVGEAWRWPFPSPLRGGHREKQDAWGSPMPSAADAIRPVQPPSANVHPPLEGEATTLSEAEAKSLLAAAGLPVPRGEPADSANAAIDAAQRLGYPVALKALGIAHKSEAGAVRLGLHDLVQLRDAAAALAGLGSGLYVERMVTGGVAELIVGVTRDPLFGPVMTVGSGGVMVELLKDSATLLLPASRDDVEAALRGLKLFPLLDGFRGRPRADIDAAVDAILGIGAFALDHAGELAELDVNPLIVCREGEGAWIADALMVTRAPEMSLHGEERLAG